MEQAITVSCNAYFAQLGGCYAVGTNAPAGAAQLSSGIPESAARKKCKQMLPFAGLRPRPGGDHSVQYWRVSPQPLPQRWLRY